ncbi:MAG TPA: DUF302 domain-containing protein [Mycobacteriales bacterium]
MPAPLITAQSSTNVASTVLRAQDALRRRSITLFAAIDHAGGARSVGAELADEVVLIFGNPQVGTGLMQRDPEVGIELPLRLLIWDDGHATRVAFTDPAVYAERYAVGGQHELLQRMREILDGLVAEIVA